LKNGAVETFGVLQLAGFVVSDGLLESLINGQCGSLLWRLSEIG